MIFKSILKSLSFSLVMSFVLASETNDCKEINNYLNKKYPSLKENTIEICNMNEQGKVVELKVNNYELQEEDVNKILSYDTIKDLEYIIDMSYDEDDEVPYYSGYSKFPSAITKLPELENLSFRYDNTTSYPRGYTYYQTPIEDGLLKLSKKLKKLTLTQVILDNQNMEELSTLTNLEEINFNYCLYDSIGLSSLGNLKNLSKLHIDNDGKVIPNNINKIKSLKELNVEVFRCNESGYDFNGLDNLEKLYLELDSECDIDMTNLKKLSELSIVGVFHSVHGGYKVKSPISLKFPNNLKKLLLSQFPTSSENYKAIASLPYLEELIINDVIGAEKLNITTLECHDKLRKLILAGLDFNPDILNDLVNLTYLDISDINFRVENRTEVPQLENLKNLEYIDLSYNQINEFPKQLTTLKNLKSIDLSNNQISIIPKEISSFKNLESLNLSFNQISKIPKEMETLENLKSINLERNEFREFPKELANIKNLEYIDLSDNEIDDQLPESLNNLENLKDFYVNDNKNISGKVLTNKSLESCTYSGDANLCIPKGYKLDCLLNLHDGSFENVDEPYKTCEEKNTTTTPVATFTTTTIKKTTSNKETITKTTTKKETITKTTTKKETITKTTTKKETTTTSKPTVKGQCGKGIGKCKSGYCCSKYGWCGKTDEYCAISQGCQSEFGDCKASTTTIKKTTTTTTDATTSKAIKGKCGKGYGKCKSGYCCSKYGWCGKTDEYCDISQGCQSEFGDCKASTTTIKKTTTVTTTTTSKAIKGKCGEGIGSCPTGYCCSKYGWCGKTDEYCAISQGCQSQFGICEKENISIEGKCGEGYGKCKSGYCCSKHGWCGKSDVYCSLSMGCQSEFGKCK